MCAVHAEVVRNVKGEPPRSAVKREASVAILARSSRVTRGRGYLKPRRLATSMISCTLYSAHMTTAMQNRLIMKFCLLIGMAAVSSCGADSSGLRLVKMEHLPSGWVRNDDIETYLYHTPFQRFTISPPNNLEISVLTGGSSLAQPSKHKVVRQHIEPASSEIQWVYRKVVNHPCMFPKKIDTVDVYYYVDGSADLVLYQDGMHYCVEIPTCSREQLEEQLSILCSFWDVLIEPYSMRRS